MYVPLRQTHQDSAVALLRLRDNSLKTNQIEAMFMQSLEQRLRMHLHVLSHSIDGNEQEPANKPYETAIWLAQRLQSTNSEHRQQAAEQACDWLSEEESLRQEGTRLALTLYRTAETDAALRKLYTLTPKLRPTLIALWEAQVTPLPQALLEDDILHSLESEQQSAVLDAVAQQTLVGIEIFRHYYNPLSCSLRQLPQSSQVLASAIRGGMIRGDTDAFTALRYAIEQLAGVVPDALLRLAHAHVAPETGYQLLALWGYPQVITDMFEGLNDPRSSKPAADAWALLMGKTLSFKPRLSLVGDEGTNKKSAEGMDQIADLDAAKAEWQAQRSTWPEDQRWLLGLPQTDASLLQLLGQYAGQNSRTIIELLALKRGSPMGIETEGWFSERIERLANYENNTSAKIPFEVTSSRAVNVHA